MRFLEGFPKKVVIAAGVILGALALFVVLLLTLGAAQVDAAVTQARLTKEIADDRKSLAQAQADRRYIVDHQERFEALLKSDRLVPHTRRVAILELQRVATADGLTSFNFNFKAAGATSPTAAQNQPKTDAYRVSVESVELKVGAPVDGDIYRFVRDITESFPGSVIVQSIRLARAPEITDAMLLLVSQGRDAGIVQGTIDLLWRTAQAQEKPAGGRSAK